MSVGVKEKKESVSIMVVREGSYRLEAHRRVSAGASWKVDAYVDDIKYHSGVWREAPFALYGGYTISYLESGLDQFKKLVTTGKIKPLTLLAEK